MSKIPQQLQLAADQVYESGKPKLTNVTSFLSWFGVKRRGYLAVKEIRTALEKAKLVTDPDFESANIRERIRLRPAQTRSEPSNAVPVAVNESEPGSPKSPEVCRSTTDPTPRLKTIEAACKKPKGINRDAKLREALTLMLQHDFSQLPVMQNAREVDGLISWKSIGEALNVHKKECKFVRDCIDTEVEILRQDTPLWKAIRIIAEKDVVLVRNAAKEIVGLVTTYDIAVAYQTLGEPFLLLGEIENNIRQLIATAAFSTDVLEKAKDPKDTERKILNISDLTFGEYIRLLQDPENWRSISINLSRSTFLEQLEAVRQIRNEVMHFHPDGLETDQLKTLQRFASFLGKLKLWNL